jgi:hypothetical protein
VKPQLEQIESLQFIFTSPTFVPGEVTDRPRKEHREFFIPKLEREKQFNRKVELNTALRAVIADLNKALS